MSVAEGGLRENWGGNLMAFVRTRLPSRGAILTAETFEKALEPLQPDETDELKIPFSLTCPEVVLNAVDRTSAYYAVLQRRQGLVGADDFLHFGQRFLEICTSVYRGARTELGVGFDGEKLVAQDCLLAPDNLAQRSLFKGADSDTLATLFNTQDSIQLRITSSSLSSGNFPNSHAEVQWRRNRGQSMFFYGTVAQLAL